MRRIHTVAAAAFALLLGSGSCIPLCGCEPAPGDVEGRVTDARGQGIANVAVELRGGGTPRVARTATTDRLGAYLFTGAPNGAYTLAVVPPAGWRMADGAAAAVEVTVRGGSTVAHDFTLTRITP